VTTGVLPGCGHLPMWDDPQMVVHVVLTATGRTAERSQAGRRLG
jgi:pimeloyl-ACP methyl ester carboxylesterase